MSFDPETLTEWERTAEIEIETSRSEAAALHRTVIWIVVDADRVFVRSVRGPAGRWYRELRAHPRGAVHSPAGRVGVEAHPVTDVATIARVSQLLKRKYEQQSPGPTAAMLREEILETTLELTPPQPSSPAAPNRQP